MGHMLATYGEVEAFAKAYALPGLRNGRYSILPDLSLDVTNCDMVMGSLHGGPAFPYAEMPVVLVGTPDAIRVLGCPQLRNLHNFPRTVGGPFNISYCSSLETLEGAPDAVGGFILEYCPALRSLEHMPRFIKGGWEFRPEPCTMVQEKHLPLLHEYPGDTSFFCFWRGGDTSDYSEFKQWVRDFEEASECPEDLPLLAATNPTCLMGWWAANALGDL